MSSHRIHLIDASPYIFRAYFAVPMTIEDSSGAPVNAVFGFANFLIKYIGEEQPTHLGIAFDGSLTTSFRNDIFPAYKAQRELPPAELEAQLNACRQFASALGAATYIDDRYEADDLIGTLARGFADKGHRVVVVSPDKDLAQLVDEQVELLDRAKGRRYDPRAVAVEFGVRPRQIPDFLGLAGDAVDNIPGVPGVGKKTAARLLGAFDDLDALYEGLDRVPTLPIRGARSLEGRLAEHRELALLSRDLATIALDAPARPLLREVRFRGADPELTEPLFERLGFERMSERVTRWR